VEDPTSKRPERSEVPQLLRNGVALAFSGAEAIVLRRRRKRAQEERILYMKKSNFSPPTFMKVRFSSLNSKTGQTTPSTFQTVHFNFLERF